MRRRMVEQDETVKYLWYVVENGEFWFMIMECFAMLYHLQIKDKVDAAA